MRLTLTMISISMLTVACNQIQQPQAPINGRVAAFSVSDHKPLPVSCDSCHESSRPGESEPAPFSANNTPVRDVFYHAVEFGGDRDCKNCHSNPANAGISFAGAIFDHLNYPEKVQVQKCDLCHEGHRPPATKPIYSKTKGKLEDAFFHDQKFAGTHECIECHSDPKQIGQSFEGAKYTHKDDTGANVATCVACHQDQRPDANTPVPSDDLDKMVHSVQYRGDQDCALCHTQNLGSDFGGNKFDHYDNHGIMVTQCNDCHHDHEISAHENHEDRGTNCIKCHSLSVQPGGPFTVPTMSFKRAHRSSSGASSSVETSSAANSSAGSINSSSAASSDTSSSAAASSASGSSVDSGSSSSPVIQFDFG